MDIFTEIFRINREKENVLFNFIIAITFNCCQEIENIKKDHPNSPIVVVDGILGNSDEIGQVKFYPCGSIPAGVFNDGVLVGDYSILAVVDAKGIDGLSLIKSVKLSMVINMAEFIAESILRAYKFAQNLI